jgi:sialic acid synthase SpsE/sugar phosphate isomerase/epimerase
MKFTIDNFHFEKNKTFFIAEIGNNHNGSIDNAKKMIDLSIEAGADCVKFQMRDLDSLYRKKSLQKDGDDLGSEYILDLLRKFEFTSDQHKELFDYCESKKILYMCTPWDQVSLDILETFDVKAYKVASADLTNTPLLESLIKTSKPLILSTGMSTEEEIKITVDYLNENNAEFALLHCNSTYPAPINDINLSWMEKLKSIHPIIGYSGHERGINISMAACALGAQIIERHFTLDRSMEGPDHAASIEFQGLKDLILGIKEINSALGSNVEKNLSQGQMINKENLSKSLMASKKILKGEKITKDFIKVASPGQGLSPQNYNNLLDKIAIRDIEEEDFFYPSDLNGYVEEPSQYNFKHAWGIPVRFHDFGYFSSKITPDLFEFHLSYSDLDLDLKDYFKGHYSFDYVVHAPELFNGSHLMDLATPDRQYRDQSLQETQRVIDMTRELNKFFPSTENPKIVANIGGISMDEFIKKDQLSEYYEIFGDSLEKLDTKDVEIIPQTMAPFPWHFGGQRYQNLFVHIDDILKWCDELNLRMCFDVSHTMLACNEFKWDFYEFSEKIAPITAHLHLGDASGTNGEGLQVGDGEIDFKRLSNILNLYAPQSTFIPEIWQGHKNGGEGFWTALDKLNNLV